MANVLEAKSVSDAALPLSHLRVVECGEGVAAAFATKLMAILGAEVIKVERPAGDVTRERGPFFDDRVDPEQSGLFLYLNADKRGVTLNLSDPGDRARLDHLLSSADVLVHNFPLAERAVSRMETRSICATHPHLIVTNISPYGERGPRSNYRAYELNVAHASGAAILAPLNSDRPELPPLKLFGHQMEFQGAIHAAFASLAACFHRIKSGGGQSIEVSSQECVAAMLELSFVFYTYQKKQTSRLGGRILGPWGIFDCADGKVLLACVEEAQWRRLVELMDDPAWAQEEIFKDRLSRGRNSDALFLLIREWTKTRTVKELFHGAQKMRIPVAPVNRMADVFNDRHIRSRGFLRRLPIRDSMRAIEVPAVPFNSSVMGSKLERPAPRLGEHNAEFEKLCRRRPDTAVSGVPTRPNGAGPLSGVRVLDFSWVWQGPFCTLQLAHLGAEVIRIESAKRIDINRVIPPFADGEGGHNRAGSFNQWNQGKRSVLLNLESREGIEIARSLVPHCDLVVENFAPGVIGRLGLGFDALQKLRPDLIMLSLSGYGQTGPYSRYVSYGGLLGAQSGLFSVSGYSNAKPLETGITYGDPNAGAFGAFAAVAALIHRARIGQGQYIDLALWEALEFVMPEAWLEYQMNRREPIVEGNRDRRIAPHNCYKSLGDAEHWISIAVRDDEEWRSLCRVMDQPALADDPRFRTRASRKKNEDNLDAIITRWTSRHDRWEATEILQRAGVAAMPTLSNKDLALDPHLKQRGFLVELEHPAVGHRIHAGVPWTMSETPCQVRRPAPLLGADTDDVLTTLLGYSPDRIADLHRTGVLA